MPHISIDRYASLAELTCFRRPLVELYLEKLVEYAGVTDRFFGDIAAIAQRDRADDSGTSRTCGRDNLLDGTTGRRQVFHYEHIFALNNLVVATADDKTALTVFIGIHCIHLLPREFGEMVRGPLREHRGGDRGTEHYFNILVFEPLGYFTAQPRGLVRIRIQRVLVDIGIGVQTRREDEVARAERTDLLQ